MTVLCSSVNSPEEARRMLAAGADEAVLAVRGCCFSALTEPEPEQLKDIPAFSVQLNRLFFPSESGKVKETLAALREMPGLRYIYFSDPAVVPAAEQLGMKEKLIYRPETLLTSRADARWWQNRGIHGVSVSPLLTEQEVRDILPAARCELTMHGYLMMTVSRRPLLSAWAEYRHRDLAMKEKKFLLREEKRQEHMPVFESEAGTMIFTDFIQESFGYAGEFAAADRFYIDGTFLNEDLLADTVTAYRQIMTGADAASVSAEYMKRWGDMPFSTGYYGQKTIR